jgi:hypothetical protein
MSHRIAAVVGANWDVVARLAVRVGVGVEDRSMDRISAGAEEPD